MRFRFQTLRRTVLRTQKTTPHRVVFCYPFFLLFSDPLSTYPKPRFGLFPLSKARLWTVFVYPIFSNLPPLNPRVTLGQTLLTILSSPFQGHPLDDYQPILGETLQRRPSLHIIKYMKGHKSIVLASVTIFLITALFVGLAIRKYNQPADITNTVLPPVTLEMQPLTKSVSTPKAGAANPKEDYTKVFTEYTGRIIQFDEQCRAFPSKSTFGIGTKIMLDNRGSLDREVAIGTHRSVIPAYDYMIYTLSSTGNLSIDCGPLKNTATILSQ